MIMPEDNRITVGKRVWTMLLDHIIMTAVVLLFGLISGSVVYIVLIGFALYFCKDCIGGQSVAKRILGLQVVNNNDGRVAKPLRCLIRNIFCVLWPIEVIV